MKAISFIFGVAVGAAGQYFLDSQSGGRRRSVATDKAQKHAREAGEQASRKADYVAGQATGAVVEATKAASPGGNGSAEKLNDPALARKVETEIFRDADAPKGKVNVNVENGVVFLRGSVDDEATAEKLVAGAQKVDGVERVESLLDAAGTN